MRRLAGTGAITPDLVPMMDDAGSRSATTTAAPSRRFGRLHYRVLGRIGWGLADQAVSSLTNVAVSFYMVHVLAPAAFGAFSLAYVTYGFALNASRGLSTDPLMVRYSGVETRRWRRAVAPATGTAITVGMVSGVLLLATSIITGGTTGTAFFALGLTLPGLMLQDSWRYAFFAAGRGGQAFLNDTIWAIALIPGIVILRMTGHATVFWVVLVWGLSAGVAAAAGPFQARVWPSAQDALMWVYRHKDLGPRYLAEGIANNAGLQLRGYGTGLMLGLTSLGYLQASVTLIGPINILNAAMGLVTIPEAARVLRRAPSQFGLFCAAIAGCLAALGLGWGIVLLVALPRGLGNLMLGPIWRPTYPLVLPTLISVVGGACSTGAAAGLHGLGASRKSLRLAIFTAVIFIGCSLTGAALGGAAGVCWGTATSSWISAVVSWWQLRAAMRTAHIPPFSIKRMIRRSQPQPDTSGPVRRATESTGAPAQAGPSGQPKKDMITRSQGRHARGRPIGSQEPR